MKMTPNLMNISLTFAGLLLIVLFYLPVFKQLMKNSKQFFLILVFWLVVLAFITSVFDYMLFSNIKLDAILKPESSGVAI